ncbi:D-alanine--D-alanine ligase, partial [Bacillus cereus group sp. N31]|nr:D-alanine--D-alanine ligase [Bacillus cereus group sp. N31]
VKIVNDKNELNSMLETVFESDTEVVIEKYIKGDELTCSIFDGKQLPIVSIRQADEVFYYNATYDDVSTIEEVIELPT